MKSVCDLCGGTGIRDEGPDQMPIECRCALLRRLASAMEPHIRKAEVLEGHTKLSVIQDGMRVSYYLHVSWPDLKAIIKLMMILNPNHFIKVTSDRELKSVFVGDVSRKTLGENAAEAVVYNSLEDLMRPPHLCIVRLNELHYKNKAASGLLEEAIAFRTDRDMPTWVIDDLDSPFGPGSPAYSERVMYLLKSLKEVQIPRVSQHTMEAPPLPIPMNSIFEPEPIGKSESRSARKIKPSTDDDAPGGVGIYGSGIQKSYAKKKNFRGE